MIQQLADINYINNFIIECLEKIDKKRTTFLFIFKKKNKPKYKKEINTVYKDSKLGNVIFTKKKDDEFINIHFVNCRYGYDFFNKKNLNTKTTDECCVCLEQTHSVIECGHKVCDDCIINIMTHSKTITCPMCRYNHEKKNGLIIKYPAHLRTLLFSQL